MFTFMARVDTTPPFPYRLPHSRTNKMAHHYINDLMINPPPLRNVHIIYNIIKLKTVCPEKNGKKRRFCKKYSLYGFSKVISPFVAEITVKSTEFS